MNKAARRITHEPGYILHSYPWSEHSLILEAFTRHHGRIALLAKGAKRPSSNFRPVLLPMQPLLLTWSGAAEIRTLKGAEWGGGHIMPGGDALLAASYASELLLRTLPREDPAPALFDTYAALLAHLAAQPAAPSTAAALRAFELLLLRALGQLPALDAQTLTLAPLDPAAPYTLVPESGLRAASNGDPALAGAHWQALETALGEAAPFAATLRATAALGAAARPLHHMLRHSLRHYCGADMHTPRLVREAKALAAAQRPREPQPG